MTYTEKLGKIQIVFVVQANPEFIISLYSQTIYITRLTVKGLYLYLCKLLFSDFFSDSSSKYELHLDYFLDKEKGSFIS